jgi:hypothetical protein
MTPVYFPFTDIPETISSSLLACFEKIVVFHPDGHLIPESLRVLSAGHRLDLRLPDVQDPDPLPALLKEYHSWAELHRGEAADFYKFGASPLPFSDDASTAWIRSEIRRMETVPSERKGDDRLLKARLFLAISQDYDQQESSLSHDLQQISTQEKALFQELSPDLETILPREPLQSSGCPDAGHPMPEKRLAAWIQLYSHCTRHNPTVETSSLPLFVTSDGEILSRLLARSNAPPLVCTVSAIPSGKGGSPAWNPFVSEQIETTLRESILEKDVSFPREIAYVDAGNCHEKTAGLSIFRINHAPVAAIFSGTCAPSDSQDSSNKGDETQGFFLGCISL